MTKARDIASGSFTGRVGIGTVTPTGILDLEGDSATQYINSTLGNANTLYQLDGTTTGSIEVGGGNSVYLTANNASGAMYLRTGGANTRMTVTSAGNVGIGDTAPDNLLHVNSGSGNISAKFESTDAISGIQLADNGGNVELVANGNTFEVRPAGGLADFKVTSAGEVYTYGAAFYMNHGGGDKAHANEFQCITVQTAISSSNTWTDVAYVSHSPNLQFHGMSLQADNVVYGGARFIGYIQGTYGSVTVQQEDKVVNAMNGGDHSDISYRYLNSGAPSGSYRLQVKLTYSGGSHDVYTCIFGNATAKITGD